MHTLFKNRKIIIALGLMFWFSYAEAQITSTFTSNAEAWTTPNDADGTIGYSATGGNPGGFVFGTPFVINLGAGSLYAPFDFVAPASYLGNRSAYYNGTLRYDIQVSSTGTPNQYPEVTIANSTGITLYYFPTISNQPAAAPSWTTFSVTLNNALGYWKTTNSATGAAATEAQVQSVLTNLASLQIRGLYRDANVTCRLDNVTFMPPLVVTTQPTSRVVCDGATTTLTTAATGNASITYQWQKDNSPVAGWVDITNVGGYSGATTATLSVNTTGNFGAGSYRCKISGTAVNDAFSSAATITVNANPSAPTTTGSSSCIAASLILSASGGAAGQYRWYTEATGGTAIAGQTNSTYTTPVISTTTTYYVSINNGTCESTRTAVVATISTTPSAPTTTGNSSCGAAAITLSAAGATAGQYRWYTVATGGTAIAGQTNSTYTTPVISTTTTYYVSINNGICEGARAPVTATINTVPSAPTTTGNSSCGAAAVTLSASGGTAGQYRWYTVATGGTAIAGQTNSTYTTPVISTTTTYYVSINNGTCESTRTAVVATINTAPVAPTTTGNSSCGAAAVTLTAAGATAGQYRWYTVATGGTAIAGQTNSTYTTPVISTTTTYYVSINNGGCEGTRSAVTANILTLPIAPTTTNNSSCGTSSITLTAAGGTPGQYRWYTVATGGTAIAGQTNSTYTTPIISTTTTYYVSINNGTCESTRTAILASILTPPAKPTITASEPINAGIVQLCLNPITLTAPTGYTYTWSSGQTTQSISIAQPGSFSVVIKDNNGCSSVSSDVVQVVLNTGCTNNPPAINATSLLTTIGGVVSIDLTSYISDPDNNLDPSSIQVIGNKTQRGGKTTLTGFQLDIDYAGVNFSGNDVVNIRVCDLLDVCIEQEFDIEVVGDITVYNGISPNGDGVNDTWIIEYIELLPATEKNKVTLYNRWGDVVWEATDYNNASTVFTGLNKNGSELPTGSYFYKIEFKPVNGIQKPLVTGYLSLKR
jgi:gliding motility-associated-like protein